MTPLLDILRARAARKTTRFHMPGHAGHILPNGWTSLHDIDFTELSDTGNLYTDQHDGPIRAAERLYSDVYHAEDCLFLTGGATQGILTMLSAFAAPGDTVILDRNCHFSVHNALALLDLHPVWVQSPLINPFGVPSGLPPNVLSDTLDKHPEAVCVLVTSPGYSGILSDLAALAAVCRTRGIPLLSDSAHGAHLPFLTGFSSPIAQGVSASVLSAHKTLPALGQSAFLLTGSGMAPLLRQRAALFGSSSPSYVLMASLDAARAYMETDGRDALAQTARITGEIRQSSPAFLGFHAQPEKSPIVQIDPLRLCLYTGMGSQISAHLEASFGIVCEMADRLNIVLIASALHTSQDLSLLREALDTVLSIQAPPPVPTLQDAPPFPKMHCSPREALFGKAVSLPWRDALGRVAAHPVFLYPPGTPLLSRGEIVDDNTMHRLAQAGFDAPVSVLL